MAFNELSFLTWLGVLVIGLPLLIIVGAFTVTFLSGFNDGIQASDAVPDSVKNLSSGTVSNTQSLWDYAFLFFFVGVVVAILAVARSTNISPFWWVFLLIVLTIMSLAAAWMSNFYAAADAGLDIASKFPIMHHIATFWMAYILGTGFLALVLSRTGPGVDI